MQRPQIEGIAISDFRGHGLQACHIEQFQPAARAGLDQPSARQFDEVTCQGWDTHAEKIRNDATLQSVRHHRRFPALASVVRRDDGQQCRNSLQRCVLASGDHGITPGGDLARYCLLETSTHPAVADSGVMNVAEWNRPDLGAPDCFGAVEMDVETTEPDGVALDRKLDDLTLTVCPFPENAYGALLDAVCPFPTLAGYKKQFVGLE